MQSDLYSTEVLASNGNPIKLSDYKSKVLLIVNVASKCGFTPQYEELQKLHDEFKNQGFEVLAFPCNQFANQEPGSNEEIASFCDLTFKTKFPIFSKIDVNGSNTAPLYKILKAEKPGLFGSQAIKWNFTKFLISKEGKVLNRYSPTTKPLAIRDDIIQALKS